MRWRCPPDRVVPRSPTIVSTPSGSSVTNSAAWLIASASSSTVPSIRAEREVAADRVVEEEGALRHERRGAGQLPWSQLAQVDARQA